ncbi:hypothetical protein BBUWI9123_F0016 (plasmid) [Borreliella burgdorferi WI91-23]|nr:hypothetical protein BBUWI9123_F0016 [Borreliella burgdorferi WI91-23]
MLEIIFSFSGFPRCLKKKYLGNLFIDYQLVLYNIYFFHYHLLFCFLKRF